MEDTRALVGVATPEAESFPISAAAEPIADNSRSTDLASTGKAGTSRRRASLGSRLLRLLDTFIAAERRRAVRRLHGHLRTPDDRQLTQWGFDKDDIATLCVGGEVDLPDLGPK